jgi:hypothetical protein
MNTNSPFGGVSGLTVKGTELRNESVVKLAVSLEIDEGVNRINTRPVDGNKFVQWDGVGTVAFTATLPSGNTVEVVFAYAHMSSDTAVHLSTTIHFNPHGYVTLPDTTLQLDRDAFIFHIPHDVVSEQFSRLAVANDHIEAIYGKRIGSPPPSQKKFNYAAMASARRPAAVVAVTKRPRNGSFVVELDAFSSFMEEKRKRELADKKHADEVLEPKWGDEILEGARRIFRSPLRVRQLIRQWHVHPPHEGKTPSEVFAKFMEALLKAQCQLQVTDTHVRFFSDAALAIPVGWLTTEEHIWVNKLFVARTELFAQVTSGFGSSYLLSRFRLDAVLKTAICTRYIVHQFALDCVESGLSLQRPRLITTLVAATGLCYVRNKRDPFLARLVSCTEQPTVYQEIQQMGMFVKIGDSDPEYDYSPPSRHNGLRQSGYLMNGCGAGSGRGYDLSRLPTLPTTPFILK